MNVLNDAFVVLGACSAARKNDVFSDKELLMASADGSESTMLTVRLSKDLAKRYDRLAKSTGRTKTFYMTEALEDAIDRLEFEYGVLNTLEEVRSGKQKTYTVEEVGKILNLDI